MFLGDWLMYRPPFFGCVLHSRKRAWRAYDDDSYSGGAVAARAVSAAGGGQGGIFKTAAIEVLNQEKRLMATGRSSCDCGGGTQYLLYNQTAAGIHISAQRACCCNMNAIESCMQLVCMHHTNCTKLGFSSLRMHKMLLCNQGRVHQ